MELKFKIVKEINLIKELKRIAEIPENSVQTCHADHIEMTLELTRLIKNIQLSLKNADKKSKKIQRFINAES